MALGNVATKSGPAVASAGALTDIDTVKRHALGLEVGGYDATGNAAAYVYLQGVANTIAGSVVTYDDAGVTTLIVADASGPVAVALAAVNATTKFGWYAVKGTHKVDVVANSLAAAANVKNPGRETTDGKVGDGRAAGDEIANFFQREATVAAALANCQFDHPYVNNFLGA